MTGIVEVDRLGKSFGGTRALHEVSFDVSAGEAHGLLGENGAGKSTLVKILSGVTRAGAGVARVNGQEVSTGSPNVAAAAGVATVFQELSLVPNLTVAQNLLLPDMPRGAFGLLSAKGTLRHAQEILETWDLAALDPRTTVADLSLAVRQRLEIVRGLWRRPRFLILDEPTSALGETSWLFAHVRRVLEEGAAVLYISHRFSEVFELCARVSVLRSGRHVGTQQRHEFSEESALRMMVGRSLTMAFPEKPPASEYPSSMLEVKGLVTGAQDSEVSLRVAAGEVVGVAALEGQGQRELFYALAGVTRPKRGTVELAGEIVRPRSPHESQQASVGMALVPEDRQKEGLFGSLTSRSNLAVPLLRDVSVAGMVVPARERKATDDAATSANISLDYLDRRVSALSGGNQQKVVFARTLLTGAACLLLFDPCRGVDARTKPEIYRLIRDAADRGGGVLMYSTELTELVGLCDRVYVIHAGRISGECAGSDLHEVQLLALMMDPGSGTRSS